MNDTLTLSQLIEALMDLQNRCSPHTPTGVNSVAFSPSAPLGLVVLDSPTLVNYDRAVELLQEAESLLGPDTTPSMEERESIHSAIRDFLDS